MLWFLIFVVVALIQWVYYRNGEYFPAIRIVIISLCVTLIAYLGSYFYMRMYFDNSIRWGIPVRILKTDDKMVSFNSNVQSLSQTINQLDERVLKLDRTLKGQVQRHAVLYNELFKSIVRLEKESNLNPVQIERLGPLSNIDLPDRSKALEVLALANHLEMLISTQEIAKSISPNDLYELKNQINELKASFADARHHRKLLFDNIYNDTNTFKRTNFDPLPENETPILEPAPYVAPQYEPPEVQKLPELEYTPPYQPIPQPYVPPSPYDRSMKISSKDLQLLWDSHRIMAEITVAEQEMSKISFQILEKTQQLIELKKLMKQSTESAQFKVTLSNAPITFMFVPEKALHFLQPGYPLYDCRVGVFWCDNIGEVKYVYPQLQSGDQPYSGREINGYITEITLTREVKNKDMLFVFHPLFD
jgi:hypothetical protein